MREPEGTHEDTMPPPRGPLAGWYSSSDFMTRLAITAFVLVVYWAAGYLPLPGLVPHSLEAFAQGAGASPQILARLSMMSLGVVPLVTAMLIVELFRICLPGVRHRIENDAGGKMWARRAVVLLTIGFAAVQAVGVSLAMERVAGLVAEPGFAFRAVAAATLVGGAIVALVLAEIVDRSGLGQGVWLLMLSGFAVDLAATLVRVPGAALHGQPLAWLLPLFCLAAVVAVVRLDAARIAGPHGDGPLPANPGGVWPILFAVTAASWMLIPVRWQMSGRHGAGDARFVSDIDLVLMLVALFAFCWLYEIAQAQDRDRPAVSARAVAPFAVMAGVLIAEFFMRQVPLLSFFRGGASLMVLAIVLRRMLVPRRAGD